MTTDEERRRAQVRPHLFLRERDTGYTFNMTTAESESAFPWLQDYWNTYGPIFGRPPGGESLAGVAKRAFATNNSVTPAHVESISVERDSFREEQLLQALLVVERPRACFLCVSGSRGAFSAFSQAVSSFTTA